MRVYHLLPARYAIADLQFQRLKVATFQDLNDPFELLAAKLPTRAIRKAFAAFKRHMHARMGILSFGPTWANPLMWTHYADNHRGICLGFDINDQLAISVKYVSARTALRFSDDLETKGIDPAFAFKLMRSKFGGWAYEKEVRMYVGLDESVQEDGLYFYRFGADLTLREVISGPRCPIPLAELVELTSTLKATINVRKARLAFNSFTVVRNKAQSPTP